MNCAAFETDIALLAGGDLRQAEARAVEEHLQQCAACAELAAELAEDRVWLHSRPPEGAQVDFAAMRREIRAGIARPKTDRRWVGALLAAAVLMAVCGVALRREKPVQPAKHAAVVASVKTEAASPVVAKAPVERAMRAQAARVQAERVSPVPEGLSLEAAIRMFEALQPREMPVPAAGDEVRIATSDPQVAIILVPETNGDSQ